MTSSATAMPLRRRIGQLTAPPAAPHTHAGRRMSARSSFGYGLPAMSCSVARVHCGDAAVWRDLELGAPRLASLAMAGPGCYSGGFVALLGTLRRDGSPRISPIEPYRVGGQLLIGVMAWSQKAADLRRDPRCVLHSAITGPDSGEGELKLYGSAVRAAEELRLAAPGAWWLAWPPDKAIVFAH